MPDLTNTPTVVAIIAGILLQPVAVLIGWLAVRRRGAIVDEPRLSLVADDPTPDDLTALADVLAVDPKPMYPIPMPPGCTWPACTDGTCTPDEPRCEPTPTVRERQLYVVPDPANMLPGLVQVGTAMVHRGCVADRRDGRTVRACCAPLLARSATEVPW